MAGILTASDVRALLPKSDSKPKKLKLKIPPVTKPSKNDSPPSSPLLSPFDKRLSLTFPAPYPLQPPPKALQCKYCKKPMLKSICVQHLQGCIVKYRERSQKRKEAKEANRKAREKANRDQRMEELERITSGAKDDDDDDDAPLSKKRKAEEPAEGAAPKKKTKKELEAIARAKAAKAKLGPVDVEVHCGVALANGGQCMRSLTCKSHSMGLKRAVPGRSMKYDLLLAAYNKKNQAKAQKAALSANAAADSLAAEDSNGPVGPVDPGVERDSIMSAIGRARNLAAPLSQRIWVPIKRRYGYVRMKEMLGLALGGAKSVIPDALTSGGAAEGASQNAESGEQTNVTANTNAERKASVVSMTSGGGQRPSVTPSRQASVVLAT